MSLTSLQSRQVPPELFVELAFGIEPPTTVAARFGYTSTEYNALAAQPWFQKALKSKQDELASQGWNFRAKMGMLAEDILTDAYVAAKASDSAAIKLEVGKYLTKVADLEPRQSNQLAAGPGFSISINLGSKASNVIDITSQDVSATSSGSLDELPPIPDYGVASFPLTSDLIGVSA